MYDYHVVLGIVAVLLVFAGYGLYFRSLFKDGTKPHPFTWFLFAVVDGTVFIAQVWNGGGPGAWATGAGTLLSSVVFLLALQRGEKRITRIDWACLIIVLVGIVGWVATSNALLAVALASACDAIAKVPTFRKSYLRPYVDNVDDSALPDGGRTHQRHPRSRGFASPQAICDSSKNGVDYPTICA